MVESAVNPAARRRRGRWWLALACTALVAAGCDGASRAAPTPPPSPAPGTPSPTPGDAASRTPARASPLPATVTPSPGGAPGDPATCVPRAGCFGPPERVGAFDPDLVPGASGLAASRRNPGVLWLLDDRPGTSEVWAISDRGDMLGAVTVEGLAARDTEALAVGACGPGDPEWCVYVGDIGDNRRRREHVTVHRFREPDLGAGPPPAVAAEAVRLTYPDGPHDAEALLAGPDGTLLVVTKAPFDRATGRTGEAHLYVAPTFTDGELLGGVVDVPAPAVPLHSQVVGNVVTGGDARDGLVLLRTYDQVLLYVAPDAADPGSLQSWPVYAVPGALEPQSEAIAWAADGCGYYTAGEQVGDLWYVPCRP